MSRRRIAVAGATGRVGRHVAEVLGDRGHDVVRISRGGGVDVITREGLPEALAGVDCVVDATASPTPRKHEATWFFKTAARNLHAIGAAAGIERIIGVSVVNAAVLAHGYGAAKAAHERALTAGPVPASVLRATQFHELVEQMLEWGRKGDVSYVPRMRTRPVAARTVAERLADLAVDPEPAAEPIADLAGPREERLVDAARMLVAQRALPIRVVEVSYPDPAMARVYESGALLPRPGATLAGPTFEEWLTARRASALGRWSGRP